MNSRVFLLSLLTTLSLSTLLRGEDLFSEANQQYASANYKQAAESYEKLVRDAQGNTPIFYNLGNAYFHLQDFGRAILNYERALALEPNHPEARTNLSTAREEAHALELQPSWRDQFQRLARPSQYANAACALFWIAAFMLISRPGANSPRRTLLVCGLLFLIWSASLGGLLYYLESGPRGTNLAIVANGETQARLATADTAANVLTLPVGSEIKIEEKRGDWAYALLPNGMHGWVPLRQIEFVRI